jgi:hypothetical protein
MIGPGRQTRKRKGVMIPKIITPSPFAFSRAGRSYTIAVKPSILFICKSLGEQQWGFRDLKIIYQELTTTIQ